MNFVVKRGCDKTCIYVEPQAFPGVKRVAGKVAGDICLVTDEEVPVVEQLPAKKQIVVAVTLGKSTYLDELIAGGLFDPKDIKGKREVYAFRLLEDTVHDRQILLIAGSDKRGTIYGLFHISELLEVSPWIWFADCMPAHRDEVVFDESVNMVSKEPSVKYRGLFINDEWPSYGNWTFSHFGGFTAQMYDHVFELLLRMHGNYLWPAMWTSNFSLDGPGLENAILADEYGIVMSNSHHEPCSRHSEEWDLVRGEDSIYGNAWNFDQNKEGLIRYWRDGLKRNAPFENIITIGMRGERDSTILGHDATLADNINYLREVITTQNELLRECIDPDLDKVPRLLALYKEVEAYFYGDESTPGLQDWEELDGVTLMLCEDNFGNMRTLPTEKMREHKGGYGMYYHFDYHGDPVSYEWVNSTYLPKVWEQMTECYEYGVRDIWIVNVGDLKPQELPLTYFLDLAYDFDKWGSSNPNSTEQYTKAWVARQFGAVLSEEGQEKACAVLNGYTRRNSICRPEALNQNRYSVASGEADRVLKEWDCIEKLAEDVLAEAENHVKKEDIDKDAGVASVYELLYFPAVASANVNRMQIYAGKNALYARQGRMDANRYGQLVEDCIARDAVLQDRYHRVADGKWDNIMRSEHVGFIYWNDEECRYPVVQKVYPARKPRMVVTLSGTEDYSMGGDWTRKQLVSDTLLNPENKEFIITVANGALLPISFCVENDAEWLQISLKEATLGNSPENETIQIVVTRDEKAFLAKAQELGGRELEAKLCIRSEQTHVDICVKAAAYPENLPQNIPFVPKTGLKIQAEDAVHADAAWQILKPYGIYDSGCKVLPCLKTYTKEDAPCMEYMMYLDKACEVEIVVHLAPSNPLIRGGELKFAYQMNEGAFSEVASVGKDYAAGENRCRQWARGVLENERRTAFVTKAKDGVNTLKIYSIDPGFVPELIEINPK